MTITKYKHACFTVEKDGKLLVVDPGGFTDDLGAPENVVGIVVTHEHADHFDANALGALIAHNPSAKIYAHESITSQLGSSLPHETVESGDELTVGPFDLQFDGGEHATIHPSMPTPANLGVHIDERIYYPGDSFYQPTGSVEILALPVSAPWCKISEVIDYVSAMGPEIAFPTHDAILSPVGQNMVDMMVATATQKAGGEYRRLHAPLEI